MLDLQGLDNNKQMHRFNDIQVQEDALILYYAKWHQSGTIHLIIIIMGLWGDFLDVHGVGGCNCNQVEHSPWLSPFWKLLLGINTHP